jgi:hypothetical protein
MRTPRRSRWLSLLVLVLLALVAPAGLAQASSPPVTITETFTQTETFTDVVPCQESLGAYNITLTERVVFHVTAAAIDEEGNFVAPYHVTGTVTGTFVAVPSDGTGPTFTGHFTQRFPGESENINNSTGTITLSIHGQGSDGSRISFHAVSHYQINALGVEAGFDKPNC